MSNTATQSVPLCPTGWFNDTELTLLAPYTYVDGAVVYLKPGVSHFGSSNEDRSVYDCALDMVAGTDAAGRFQDHWGMCEHVIATRKDGVLVGVYFIEEYGECKTGPYEPDREFDYATAVMELDSTGGQSLYGCTAFCRDKAIKFLGSCAYDE